MFSIISTLPDNQPRYLFSPLVSQLTRQIGLPLSKPSFNRLFIPSSSTSRSMTPPMCRSPLTRRHRSTLRSVTSTFSSQLPSPTNCPSEIISSDWRFCYKLQDDGHHERQSKTVEQRIVTKHGQRVPRTHANTNAQYVKTRSSRVFSGRNNSAPNCEFGDCHSQLVFVEGRGRHILNYEGLPIE